MTTLATDVSYQRPETGGQLTTAQAVFQREVWVEDYLAPGFNASTGDATSAIAAGVAALALLGGGILKFSRGYLFNYVLDTPNIILQGVAGLSNSNPSPLPVTHRAFDPTQYCLQLGRGTTLRRGIGVINMSFDGRNSAQFGVKICGVYNMTWRSSGVIGFTTENLYVTSVTVATSSITFQDFCFATPNTGTARAVYIEYGGTFTTGLFFGDGTIVGNCAGASLALNGVKVDMNNTYISVNAAGAGVKFLAAGTILIGQSVRIDAASNASTYVVVSLPTASTDGAHLVESYLRGYFTVNGLLQFSDAATIDPYGASYRLSTNSLMSYPITIGPMTFLQSVPTADDSTVNPNTQPQITSTSTSWNFTANAAVDITFTPGTGKAVKIVGKFVVPSGATLARPTSPGTGTHYFDTTIGKPIWYSGANWVDATGSTV